MLISHTDPKLIECVQVSNRALPLPLTLILTLTTDPKLIECDHTQEAQPNPTPNPNPSPKPEP